MAWPNSYDMARDRADAAGQRVLPQRAVRCCPRCSLVAGPHGSPPPSAGRLSSLLPDLGQRATGSPAACPRPMGSVGLHSSVAPVRRGTRWPTVPQWGCGYERLWPVISRGSLDLEVWTRNCEVKRRVAESAGPLGSGVEAPDVVRCGVQGIFRACEVREPEYPPGPKFR
jgi:hypothetical protein